MKILHLTDTHLGLRRRERGRSSGSAASDHLEAARVALGPALRGEVDAVVHSGDVFDRSRPPARAVADACALFRAVARRVPMVLMPGNHDRRGLWRHLPTHHANLHVVDEPVRLVLGGVALGLVPFRRYAQAWARDAARLGGADLYVAHQAFDGACVPGHTFRVGRQRDTLGAEHLPRDARWILCGHIHPRQLTVVGGVQVVQPGSTCRTSFSERHEQKGYGIWQLERDVRWRFVDLPGRHMMRLHTVEDLDRIGRGSLVSLAPGLRSSELEQEVQQRGGWLCSRPADDPIRAAAEPAPQLGLFAS